MYTYAVTKPVEFGQVRVEEGYWKNVRDQARDSGLPKLYEQYENRNIVRNFIAAATGAQREAYGSGVDNARNFDEFLWKALEAGAYHLGDPTARQVVRHYQKIREIVLSAQQPDGYLVSEPISLNLEHFSSKTRHEMYNGGHMMQAGIAELRTTGEPTLYEATKRYVDLLVAAYAEKERPLPRFRDAFKWPDHPNIEMAVVELFRVTGERKYLDFCRQILNFSEFPSRNQLAHHAVQEILHATGAADYYLETGSPEILVAIRRLWESLLKRVYITGGVGSVNRGSMNEAAGKDFELTNTGAYSETCAAVSLVFWAWRMFLIDGKATYIDMLERALYNGVQAGIARNGYEYFYENPLEYRRIELEGTSRLRAEDLDYRSPDRGGGARSEVHSCSCCPPNVQRLYASLSQYIYSRSEEDLWINLFVNSSVDTEFDSVPATVTQTSRFPWEGSIGISVRTDRAARVSLKIRIPGWCDLSGVRLDGREIDPSQLEDGYLRLQRDCDGELRFAIEIPMEVQLIRSHPKNTANYGKVVIERGPIIYCLEQIDHPDVDIFSIVLSNSTDWRCVYEEALLGGITSIQGQALARDLAAWDDNPYQAHPVEEPRLRPTTITAIPYYAWANRGRCSMVTALPLR